VPDYLYLPGPTAAEAYVSLADLLAGIAANANSHFWHPGPWGVGEGSVGPYQCINWTYNYNYDIEDYESALLASAYASLINVPLVIEGTSSDTENVFSGKK